MATIERLMIEEAFDSNTYRVLSTPLKEGVPSQEWGKVSKDDLSWWSVEEEEYIWAKRKLRKELGLSSDVPLLEGMVFIRVREGRTVKEIVPYTSQARAASREIYGKVLKAQEEV